MLRFCHSLQTNVLIIAVLVHLSGAFGGDGANEIDGGAGGGVKGLSAGVPHRNASDGKEGGDLSLFIHLADSKSRDLTASEKKALVSEDWKGSDRETLGWLGVSLHVGAEQLRMQATQEALVEVAADMLQRPHVQRVWNLPYYTPTHTAGTSSARPPGTLLLAMASYLKMTTAHTHTHAEQSPPALYPPRALHLTPMRAAGSGGTAVGQEKRVVWDILEAVAAGVVRVERVEASGWCDRVEITLRSGPNHIN
jgi:hypothetical protein